MAKTFGTGADPKGLVNRGVEGSGAAQIFRPSQAAQDFVTRQARGEQQRVAQKRAEAKAKVEKQKEIDKYAIDADVATFMQKDNEEALARLGALEGKLANLKVMGIDPRNDIEFKKEEYAFKQYISNLKNEQQAYEKGVANFIAISKDPNYEPEQINDFATRLEVFRQSPSGQRFEVDTNPPQKPLKIDYEKAVSDVVKNVKGNKSSFIDEKSGAVITTVEVPKEEINNTVNYFKTTPAYKQKTKSLIEEGLFDNESDAKEFLDENLRIRFYNQRTTSKGDTGSGYGDGAASTYRAEYENIRPSDINIESYGLTPAEAINMGIFKPLSAPAQKPYLRSIDISSSPKKAPVPLTIESNIKYKLDGKEYALTSNDPIIPSRLVEYNTLDGTTKYLFLFNIKGTGNAAAVIDSGNKEVFERYFLKQGKTIEDYLSEGEKTKNVNATPKSTAVTATPKTPQKKITFPEWKAKNPNGTYTDYKKQNP